MDLAFYFRSPAHIKILETLSLMERPVCFRDLVEFSGVSISSAQNALRFFEKIKLVRSKRSGQEKQFVLHPHLDLELLQKVFSVAAKRPGSEIVLSDGLAVLRAVEEANRLARRGVLGGRKRSARTTA